MALSTTSLSAILAALLSLLLVTSSSSAGDDVIVPTELAASSNEFSCDLYRQVRRSSAEPGSNDFMSPLSVFIGLAMVHAGAKGGTRSQLEKAMHLEKYHDDETIIGEAFQRMLSTVNDPANNCTLRIANRLYASDVGLQIRKEFLNFTEQYFKAGLMALNFAGAWDESRRTINRWVSDNTEQKITDLLSEGSITSATVMVVVNAIYFKGLWLNSFQKESTKRQTFHLSRSHQTTVDMMTRPVTMFNYHNSTDLDCQVLELPYVGKEASMFVFLPRDAEGLSAVESRLNALSLAETFKAMQVARVQASLPRFTEDRGVQLKRHLRGLGVADAFDELHADLSGIDGTKRLAVSEAVHRAYIGVDEEGTEAAGATAFVLKTKSATITEDLPLVVFKADRPFLYAIVNRATGCVMFLGRFADPSSPSGAGGNGGESGRTAEKRFGGQKGAAGSNGPQSVWLLLLLLTSLIMRKLV